MAAMVASARPPSLSRAAIERTKTPASSGSLARRTRSPSKAPPERFEEGSTAITPTLSPRPRSRPITRPTRVDLPTPGGPVTPITRPRGAA